MLDIFEPGIKTISYSVLRQEISNLLADTDYISEYSWFIHLHLADEVDKTPDNRIIIVKLNIDIEENTNAEDTCIDLINIRNKSMYTSNSSLGISFYDVSINVPSTDYYFCEDLLIKMREYDNIEFVRCNFSSINMRLEYCPEKRVSSKEDLRIASSALVKNSKFRSLDINYNSFKDHYRHGAYGGLGFLSVLQANKIETFIHNVSFNKDDSNYRYKPANVLKITDKNDIKLLRINGEYPDLQALGIEEKLGFNVKNHYEVKNCAPVDNLLNDGLYENKNSLLKFKKAAVGKYDKVLEASLNKHISYCDEQIMDSELSSRKFLFRIFSQDIIIMKLGSWLSDHGNSWLKPLLWILFINSVASFFIYHFALAPNPLLDSFMLIISGEFASMEYNFLLILFDLLNPISSLSNIFPAEGMKFKGGQLFAIISLVLFAKLSYAICAYEFVRAARKFTIR